MKYRKTFSDYLQEIGIILGIILLIIAGAFYMYIQTTESIARRDAMEAITRKLNSGGEVSETDMLIIKTSLDNENAKKNTQHIRKHK